MTRGLEDGKWSASSWQRDLWESQSLSASEPGQRSSQHQPLQPGPAVFWPHQTNTLCLGALSCHWCIFNLMWPHMESQIHNYQLPQSPSSQPSLQEKYLSTPSSSLGLIALLQALILSCLDHCDVWWLVYPRASALHPPSATTQMGQIPLPDEVSALIFA